MTPLYYWRALPEIYRQLLPQPEKGEPYSVVRDPDDIKHVKALISLLGAVNVDTYPEWSYVDKWKVGGWTVADEDHLNHRFIVLVPALYDLLGLGELPND